MKISHRLYLTVTPAILAVLLLAGLGYWGQFARTTPEYVLVGGAVAVLASLVMTWANARYVSQRLERIVGGPTAHGTAKASLRGVASAIVPGRVGTIPDEIDEIESVVDRLSSAIEIAEVKSADREMLFEQRAHDYALLLASIADDAAKRLEEVRLPLHILLDNHFGELNENQEEMLGAARCAAEAADADMLSLRRIASFDLGEQTLREDRMKPSDIVDALRPLLIAAAQSSNVTIEFDIAPLIPGIIGDRALLQDALVTILRDSIMSSQNGERLRLCVDRDGASVRFDLERGGPARITVRSAAAARVVQAHGVSVERHSDRVRITFPAEGER